VPHFCITQRCCISFSMNWHRGQKKWSFFEEKWEFLVSKLCSKMGFYLSMNRPWLWLHCFVPFLFLNGARWMLFSFKKNEALLLTHTTPMCLHTSVWNLTCIYVCDEEGTKLYYSILSSFHIKNVKNPSTENFFTL